MPAEELKRLERCLVIRQSRLLERSRRKENVALDDRLGDIDELASVGLRVTSQQFEGLVRGNRVASHEDALGLLDRRPPPESALQALVFGEPLQGDVDRALELVGGSVDDVGEDAALGGLVDIGRIVRVK